MLETMIEVQMEERTIKMQQRYKKPLDKLDEMRRVQVLETMPVVLMEGKTMKCDRDDNRVRKVIKKTLSLVR